MSAPTEAAQAEPETDTAAGPGSAGGPRASPADAVARRESAVGTRQAKTIEARALNLFYGDFHAVENVTITIEPNKVTALIGSSGCGKTTFLRSLNRMHELTPGARVEGQITLDGQDIYAKGVDPVEVRRLVGMVFQSPNPFPTMSIYENVAAGLNLNASKVKKSDKDDVVERALRGAHLWEEVKDRLDKPGTGLSGGQQQRLCIARATAVEPEVLLDGRALLRPGPGRDPGDRGADPGPEDQVHDRDRHPQHAAGGAGQRHHRLLQPRRNRQARPPGRDRGDRDDLHQPLAESDRGLRQRAVRMTPNGIRVEYQQELEQLEDSALGGLDLASAALERTLEAVEHQDVELAQIVVADDDRIDGRYLEVHQALITLLATQSPVATDLRLISALLHVLKNVERMGDQSVNICKMIPLSGNEPPADREMVKMIIAMGRQARILISQAKRAFKERDVDMARDLVRQDDVVDRLNRDCFRLALEIGDDADKREWAMTMLLAARAIERIGDNAVDIGEQVAFVVTGLFREFEDASHPTA